MSSNMILFDVKLTVETIVNFGDPIGYEVVKVFNKTLKELFTSSICFTIYQHWIYVYIYITSFLCDKILHSTGQIC